MKILAMTAAVAAGVILTSCGGGDMSTPAPTSSTAAPAPMPQEPAAPATTELLTTNEDSLLAEPTWAVLFAGHDLTAFNQIGGGNWSLADGYVDADAGEPGFLVTKGAYTNFEIRVEFQASPDTNSGVFIRCEDPNDVSAQRCYEINIFDNNENASNRTGAIVNLAPPATSVMAGDQWNTLDITAQGSHLTVRFNDTVTADVENDKHADGYIALQYMAGPIKFRDVRWRPL
jgi:3-keto-disaccharide hydrolase